MSAAPLYVGPGTAAGCAAAAEAVAAKRTQREVAEEFGVSRSTLRRYLTAAANMATLHVYLEREGSQTLKVCDVVTPKGALAAAVAAYREFPGTLKQLELPGWKLRVGGGQDRRRDRPGHGAQGIGEAQVMRAMAMRHAVNHDTFAQRLRRAREHACLTVDSLGDKADMLPRRVQKYEDGAGAPPSPEEITRLASACGVEPMWLMAGDIAGRKFAPEWEGGAR